MTESRSCLVDHKAILQSLSSLHVADQCVHHNITDAALAHTFLVMDQQHCPSSKVVPHLKAASSAAEGVASLLRWGASSSMLS